MNFNLEEVYGLITAQIVKAEGILSLRVRSLRELRELEAVVRKWDLVNRDILRSCQSTVGLLADYERVGHGLTADQDLRSSNNQLRKLVMERLEVLSAAKDRIGTSSEVSLGRGLKNLAPMTIFLVHGHDHSFLYEVKDYLQNTLSLPEPIVLSQKPSGGRTVIEKFEDYASKVDVAIVLLSPDDVGGTADNTLTRRARQNVIFELGYFVGQFGRKSGRVILLHKKGVDIPSDLAGIIYIEVNNGVQAAGESIRTELGILQGAK